MSIRKKILVIEDDDIIRDNLISLLELKDYDARSAENGKEGIDKAFTFKPDLILCDIMMPDINGFEVLDVLSRESDFRRIPFLYLTALSENTNFIKGMNLGAEDYITKPYDTEKLLAIIKNRLDKYDFINSLDKKSNSASETKELEKVLIKFGNKTFPLELNKVVYLRAERQYSYVFTSTPKKFVIKKSLREWESLLPKINFIRIHRSFIVNIDHINRIEKNYTNHYSIKLNGYDNIEVSRRFYKNLKTLRI